MTRVLLLACLLVQTAALLAQSGLEVIELRNRSVEQVLPVMRGLVEPGGVVSGQGYQLFVRTSRANLDELKRALTAMDTPARRLLISVRFESASEASRKAIDARGAIRSGDASLGNQRFPANRMQAEVRVLSNSGASNERVDQRVPVLEGSRALISTGQSRPLQQRQVFSGPGGTVVRESTVIQDIDTGFEVTPRVSGNTVFLDIHPQRETPGVLGTGSVQSQRVSSSISASLGEWVELGSAVASASGSMGGVLSSREAQRAETRGVWVRVEELRP